MVGTFVPNKIAVPAGDLSRLPALRQGTEPPSAAWSPPLVSYAGSWGMGNPSLTLVDQERFVRKAQVGPA